MSTCLATHMVLQHSGAASVQAGGTRNAILLCRLVQLALRGSCALAMDLLCTYVYRNSKPPQHALYSRFDSQASRCHVPCCNCVGCYGWTSRTGEVRWQISHLLAVRSTSGPNVGSRQLQPATTICHLHRMHGLDTQGRRVVIPDFQAFQLDLLNYGTVMSLRQRTVAVADARSNPASHIASRHWPPVGPGA